MLHRHNMSWYSRNPTYQSLTEHSVHQACLYIYKWTQTNLIYRDQIIHSNTTVNNQIRQMNLQLMLQVTTHLGWSHDFSHVACCCSTDLFQVKIRACNATPHGLILALCPQADTVQTGCAGFLTYLANQLQALVAFESHSRLRCLALSSPGPLVLCSWPHMC